MPEAVNSVAEGQRRGGRNRGGEEAQVADELDHLELFYGELSPQRAWIYARLPREVAGPAATLRGQVRGPCSRYAQTLPLTVPLVDAGPGPTLLAQALLPDPCYWLPETPLVYEVNVTLLRAGQPAASVQRFLALRPLGVAGDRLKLAGKTWVPRGVWRTSSQADAPQAWRQTQSMLVLDDVPRTPPAELALWLEEALWCGVPVAVHLEAAAWPARLAWLARHPAVGLAVLPPTVEGNVAPAELAPNVLVAQRLARPEDALAPWAQVAWVEGEAMADVVRALPRRLPVIAAQKLPQARSPEEARQACDALQRALAPLGPLAGFVV